MKKYIICLANSYKNGGRCIAGVEIQKKDGRINIVKNANGTPKWIRPIVGNGNDGVPENLAQSFSMLDILEIEVVQNAPEGMHSENAIFTSVKKIERVACTENNISLLCDTIHPLIFDNKGKAVASEVFDQGGYSLMFIKPENPVLQTQVDEYGHEKYRFQFTYRNNGYDLPLTDAKYIHLLQNRNVKGGELYFTLSLGVKYGDFHYKLISRVIELGK